jgi:serine/threonine protein kinase
MKQCPVCNTDYPDQHDTCPTDGALLLTLGSSEWAPGTLIRGKYRILATLGKGGMGIVYKAQHITLEEFRALKVMFPQLAAEPKFRQRFLREARETRKLRNNPHVVAIEDQEQAEDGSLYIVMEYVNGVSLRDLLRAARGPLPPAQAFKIARGMAEGLQAAHALGIVHRDIKPDNILIARDAAGREVTKVADFGIMALKESSTALSSGPLLTAPYAAPEQWKGESSKQLDGRTDLYALGMTLYEMLTGRLPFQAETPVHWMHAHLMQQPPPPSQFRPELAKQPAVDALVLKLVAKDPNERPADAQAFLQELSLVESQASWKQLTPPAATPDAPTTPLRPPVTPGIAPEAAPTSARAEPPSSNAAPPAVLPPVPPASADAATTPPRAPMGEARADAQASPRPTWSIWKKTASLLVLTLLVAAAGLWLSRSRTNAFAFERTFSGHSAGVSSVAFSPDGQWLASGSDDSTVKVWSVGSGELARTFRGHKQGVNALAFSPDGHWLASGSNDSTAKIWSVGNGDLAQTLSGHKVAVNALAFSLDGRWLASASPDTISLWDFAQLLESQLTARAIGGGNDHTKTLAFSPDGRRLATGGDDQKIKIWDVGTGELIRTQTEHTDEIYAVTYSADGHWMASGSEDETIKIWEANSGMLMRTLTGHTKGVYAVAFSPDGRWMASGSGDRTIKVWEVGTGKLVQTLAGHDRAVDAVAFNGDGRWLASGSLDSTIKLWKWIR